MAAQRTRRPRHAAPHEPAPAPTSVPPVRRAGTVALIGRSNVGKSTLLNALLGEDLSIVSSTPQTTRESVLGVVRHHDAQIGVLDTPGLHKPKSHLGKRMNAAARTAALDADVILFVVDAGASFKGSEPAVHPGDEVLLSDADRGKPLVLLLNKVDLVRPRDRLLPLIAKFADVRPFDAVVPISARRANGLGRVLDEVAQRLPERGPLWGDDDLTDKPIRFFAAEFVRERILATTRAELPYATAVTIETFEEGPKGVRIGATVHVEREGQKAILVGKGGAKLREIGSAARVRVSEFLGRPAHLVLFVRVSPGWSDDPHALDEFGYLQKADET